MASEFDDAMRLKVLKPSRKKLNRGDIFVMQPEENLYVFGRVIRTDAMIGPFTGCNLIYVYDAHSSTKDNVPELRPSRLLVSPIMTNRQAWLKGYFETVARSPLTPEDILPQHCFRSSNGDYFDEANHQLPGPVEPVGDWGVASYASIDQEVRSSLDFRRARG